MDFKRLIGKAKKTVDDRGGMEALKADAKELQKVAKGKGSLGEKAKKAASAIKDPGAAGGEHRKGAGAGGERPKRHEPK
jgi:hypothetical protein